MALVLKPQNETIRCRGIELDLTLEGPCPDHPGELVLRIPRLRLGDEVRFRVGGEELVLETALSADRIRFAAGPTIQIKRDSYNQKVTPA